MSSKHGVTVIQRTAMIDSAAATKMFPAVPDQIQREGIFFLLLLRLNIVHLPLVNFCTFLVENMNLPSLQDLDSHCLCHPNNCPNDFSFPLSR